MTEMVSKNNKIISVDAHTRRKENEAAIALCYECFAVVDSCRVFDSGLFVCLFFSFRFALFCLFV